MAESVVLKTQKRDVRGTKASERLRRQGLVPAVLYGHKEATEAVSLAHDALLDAIRHGARVVDLHSDKGIQKAQIPELQWDHLGKDVLHADFKRVSADERITIQIRIELRGIAPGVTAGGLLEQPMHTVTIECLAIAVPDSIRVNVAELQLDGAIHVRDLTLPAGVKAMDDPDAVVVHVAPPQAEPEPTAAEAAAQAEPEIVGRRVAEAEEEKEKK
jgi:large subunit ribosomal protein L25